MTTMKKNFFTEFGLLMTSDNEILSYPNKISELDLSDKNHHIYMIHKTPKITIDPSSIKASENHIQLVLNFQQNDGSSKNESIKFQIHEKLNHELLEFTCVYPYNIITAINPSIDSSLEISALSLICCLKDPIPLEILYIGQSLGKDNTRVAQDRLKSHETLQKILSEINFSEPDKDVLVSMWEFVPKLIPLTDMRSTNVLSSAEKDLTHVNDVLNHTHKTNQLINITEAALINYFKPEYNIKFKNNFPDKNHNYKDYYSLEFNSITVELWAEDLFSTLFTKENKYDPWKFITYGLHSEDVQNMYDLFKNK